MTDPIYLEITIAVKSKQRLLIVWCLAPFSMVFQLYRGGSTPIHAFLELNDPVLHIYSF